MEIIEWRGKRILTTDQVADSYEADIVQIHKNFNYNKHRFAEGKHYFELKGEELKRFKTTYEIRSKLKHSPVLYLWTDKGAFLHAKSLNTDRAWEAYTTLVDEYFNIVQPQEAPVQIVQRPSSVEDLIIMQAQSVKELKNEVAELRERQVRDGEKLKQIDEVRETVISMADNLTAVPDHTKVVSTVNEYARWTRLGHNEVYNKVYDFLKRVNGIDVRQRVENERDKIQKEYHEKTGKWYSESTLKSKVNGIDVMVRIGCLDKFHSILVGMLAKEKAKSQIRLVQ